VAKHFLKSEYLSKAGKGQWCSLYPAALILVVVEI
jgi:hypothetical protein